MKPRLNARFKTAIGALFLLATAPAYAVLTWLAGEVIR